MTISAKVSKIWSLACKFDSIGWNLVIDGKAYNKQLD